MPVGCRRNEGRLDVARVNVKGDIGNLDAADPNGALGMHCFDKGRVLNLSGRVMVPPTATTCWPSLAAVFNHNTAGCLALGHQCPKELQLLSLG